jgi:hypothetical protein
MILAHCAENVTFRARHADQVEQASKTRRGLALIFVLSHPESTSSGFSLFLTRQNPGIPR